MSLKDIFVFVEENSESNDVVQETREDLVTRINDMVTDFSLDDTSCLKYLINDRYNDNKIIDGIEAFIGSFIEIKRRKK